MAALRAMLREVLPLLAAGEQPRTPQDERYATWVTRRTAADGLIDWRCEAAAIDRLVRAVGHPYPGAFTYADGRRLTVWATRLVTGTSQHHALCGQIVSRRDGTLLVKTGGGLIELVEWECEGGSAPAVHSVLANG